MQNTHVSIKSGVLYFVLFEDVHRISLSYVFDPKPDADVINCIINLVNFNPRDWKHIHLHQ